MRPYFHTMHGSSNNASSVVSGPSQGFVGAIRTHVLDDAVWTGDFRGRFDAPHTARWVHPVAGGPPVKISWKVARTPFGFTESGSGRLYCELYFPDTAETVSGSAVLSERQRQDFRAALESASAASSVLRLQDRGRSQRSGQPVSLTPDEAQSFFRALSTYLANSHSRELANAVVVWQSFGQKLPLTGQRDVVSLVRELRSTFTDAVLENVRTGGCL